MRIKIITIGNLKEKYLREASAEYVKRVSRYATVEVVQLPEEKLPSNFSPADVVQCVETEAVRIMTKINPNAYIVDLSIEGKMLSSEDFAKTIEQLQIDGESEIVFIIGGSDGLSEKIKERSNLSLSFSKMTFPHQLMRVILLEQVYRAFKIIHNEPYHK